MGHFALSVVGRDRPGIVAEVSRVLFELGCNIEDSTCTILSGAVRDDPRDRSPEILSGGRDRPFLRTGPEEHGAHDLPAHAEGRGCLSGKGFRGKPHIISVYGADRPGIVYSVARELARLQVNVTDLNTQVVGAKDRPVYMMVLEVDIPGGST